MRITKEEFEANYINNSCISAEFYHKHMTTMVCDPVRCDYEGCKGWAAVHKGHESDHIEDQGGE
jgi:hypothetical protein